MKKKITNLQLLFLTEGFLVGTAPLVISGSIASLSGKDAWISCIFAFVIGIPCILINIHLGSLYPDKTVVEVIQLLFGKWFGSLISACFIFVLLVAATQVLWYVGDFMTTMYTPDSPALMYNVLMLAVVAIALLYGLEASCRARKIIYFITYSMFAISIILLLKDVKTEKLLPIFENGIAPVFKGTIPILCFTAFPITALNMVYPVNTGVSKKTKMTIFYGYLLAMFTIFVFTIMCVLILGGTLTANMRFPLFVITKEINAGVIFTRLEASILIVWLAINSISTFVFAYSGIVGLSQLLKLADYKNIVMPVCLIIAIYSDVIYKSVPYEMNWDSYVWAPISLTFGVILPIILLVTHYIRQLVKIKTGSNNAI